MSYIDALYKKDEDKIYVVERDPKKGRVFVEYDARYVFTIPMPEANTDQSQANRYKKCNVQQQKNSSRSNV